MKNLENFPYVSLNGDKAETLQSMYRECLEGVQQAIEVLGNNTPNGRNYLHDDCDYQSARNEHSEYMQQLSAMEDRFTQLWISVDK